MLEAPAFPDAGGLVDTGVPLVLTVPRIEPPRGALAGVTVVVVVLAATGERAFDNDAAVGLLSLSAELTLKVDFFAGVGSSGWALRDLAKDAAVGANNPVEGVFGRFVGGDLARERREGVLARAGVEVADFGAGLLVDAVDVVDWPVCCGLRGCATGGTNDCLACGLLAGLVDTLAAVLD